jgi:K+ transporter
MHAFTEAMLTGNMQQRIAAGVSVFQLCTLVAFYMTTKPNVSISHVFACYESECIAFTIVMTMLTYFQLLHLMLHFFNRDKIDHNTMINHNSKAATEQEEAQKTGMDNRKHVSTHTQIPHRNFSSCHYSHTMYRCLHASTLHVPLCHMEEHVDVEVRHRCQLRLVTSLSAGAMRNVS